VCIQICLSICIILCACAKLVRGIHMEVCAHIHMEVCGYMYDVCARVQSSSVGFAQTCVHIFRYAYMQTRIYVICVRVCKVRVWDFRLCAYLFIHIYKCANTHTCNVPLCMQSSCVGFSLRFVRVFVYSYLYVCKYAYV